MFIHKRWLSITCDSIKDDNFKTQFYIDISFYLLPNIDIHYNRKMYDNYGWLSITIGWLIFHYVKAWKIKDIKQYGNKS